MTKLHGNEVIQMSLFSLFFSCLFLIDQMMGSFHECFKNEDVLLTVLAIQKSVKCINTLIFAATVVLLNPLFVNFNQDFSAISVYWTE